MRKDLGKKLLFLPLPVAVIGTYDKAGNPNAMTVAWATIYDFGKVFISMSPHLTTNNIKLNKCFTVMFATKKTTEISDYFGIVSGKNENKIKKAKVHVLHAKCINAPIIEEFPVAIECKLVSLKDGDLIGQIVNVNADCKYITNGKLNTEKMNLICYDMSNQTYRTIGKSIAKAFNCGKKVK